MGQWKDEIDHAFKGCVLRLLILLALLFLLLFLVMWIWP